MFNGNTKVLIVDDFKTMRKIVASALAGIGVTNVTEAEDGADALPMIEAAAAAKAPFGLIISDWNMPKMQGIELLRHVRGNTATAKTPFLMITAEAEQKNIVEALQLGVSNYIVKPFSASVFIDKLTAVYKKHAGNG